MVKMTNCRNSFFYLYEPTFTVQKSKLSQRQTTYTDNFLFAPTFAISLHSQWPPAILSRSIDHVIILLMEFPPRPCTTSVVYSHTQMTASEHMHPMFCLLWTCFFSDLLALLFPEFLVVTKFYMNHISDCAYIMNIHNNSVHLSFSSTILNKERNNPAIYVMLAF